MKNKVSPRSVPGRDEFYMGMAFWAAAKSKDPKTQCGAVIVSSQNEPLGWGYNGPPRQIDDNNISWGRPEKYDWINHAETNAIEYSHRSTKGATIYVTGHPCKDCMLDIVTADIYRVVWFRQKTDGKSQTDPDPKAIEIAEKGKVKIEEFSGNLNWMRDQIQMMEQSGVFE